MSAAKTWRGAAVLKRHLVAIDDLEPFPGNPRRGDVIAVRASLRRFGQTKPILVDAARPERIIAGHHVRLAAAEEGWTHVAVLAHEFKDEEEARAYLIADNRTHDLGTYSTEELVSQLRELAEGAGLDGTGFTADDLDDLLAQLRRAADAPVVPPADRPRVEPGGPELSEVVLLYSPAQRRQLEDWLKIVAKERGSDGVSATVYEAARIAAQALNQA